MHSQQKHDQSNKIYAVQEIQGRAGQNDYLSLCTLYNFIVEFHISVRGGGGGRRRNQLRIARITYSARHLTNRKRHIGNFVFIKRAHIICLHHLVCIGTVQRRVW